METVKINLFLVQQKERNACYFESEKANIVYSSIKLYPELEITKIGRNALLVTDKEGFLKFSTILFEEFLVKRYDGLDAALGRILDYPVIFDKKPKEGYKITFWAIEETKQKIHSFYCGPEHFNDCLKERITDICKKYSLSLGVKCAASANKF